jgi:hypothetical protein
MKNPDERDKMRGSAYISSTSVQEMYKRVSADEYKCLRRCIPALLRRCVPTLLRRCIITSVS